MPELDDHFDEDAHVLGQHDFTHAATRVERVMHRVTPPLQRLEHYISTPVNFLILPIFAFVNAQVRLVGVDMGALLVDPVTLGTYLGMLLGKPIGIFGVTFVLVKLGLAELPRRVNWKHIVGVAFWAALASPCRFLLPAWRSRLPSSRSWRPRLPSWAPRSQRPWWA